jgi:hypothetical protein
LLVGFRTLGGSTDVIVDLGGIDNFQQTGALPQTFDLSAVLNSVYGGVSGSLYWSVFGVNDTSISPANGNVTQADPNSVWFTQARSNPLTQTHVPLVVGSSTAQQLAVGDIETIGSSTSSSSGAPITVLAFNAISVNNTTGFGYSPSIGSGGDFNGDWGYDIENNGAGTSDLYQADPGSPFVKKSTYLGDFTLDPSGTLTYNSVPEPSTWTMLATGALSLMAIGRFRNRK